MTDTRIEVGGGVAVVLLGCLMVVDHILSGENGLVEIGEKDWLSHALYNACVIRHLLQCGTPVKAGGGGGGAISKGAILLATMPS